MATSRAKPPAPNLATLVAIKGKMTANNRNQPESSQPPAMTGSRSDEKTTYHQNWSVQDPQEKTTAAPPTNTTDQPKISRKTKQLEVTLLDKKMEEINLKQEAKKNEALDTWKGFDSVNYGFIPESGQPKSTAVSPATKKQRTPTSSPPPKQQPSPVKTEPPREKSPIQPQSAKKHRSPTPRRVDSPIKDQPRSKSPPRKDEKHQSPTPKRVNSPIKDQPRAKSPPRKDEKHRSPTPRRVNSPIKDQPRSKSPSREEEKPPPRQKAVQNQPTPPPSPKHEKIHKKRSPSPPQHQEKSIEKQSSSPTPEKTSTERHPSPPPRRKSVEKQPSPPPHRRSKVIFAPSVEKAKSPEQQVKSQSPTPIIENIIPFPSTTTHPQIFGKHVPSFEQSSLPISTTPHVKLFPDIKHSEMKRFRNANKSIQRSMDRYRFHIW